MAHRYLWLNCEDNEQREFFKGVLKGAGFIKNPRQLKIMTVGGEGQVLRNLAEDASKVARYGTSKARLLTCIDADKFDQTTRCRQAEDAAGGNAFAIVVGVVPVIEIEWWILELAGEPLEGGRDALTSERKRYASRPATMKKAVEACIAGLSQEFPPINWSDSLKLAHAKLRKLRTDIA